MIILLLKIFFCCLMPSSGPKVNIAQPNNVVMLANEETKKEERADTNLENILFGSGVGLVAVGGVGAGVIAYNNSKPKNVPTKKSEGTTETSEK